MTNGEARSVGHCLHGSLRRQCEACDREDRLDMVRDVYERFKHLDELLMDDVWMEAGSPSPHKDMLRACWRAIREASR